jgi:hypothetical protein
VISIRPWHSATEPSQHRDEFRWAAFVLAALFITEAS